MAEPLLELKTVIERPTIIIDGKVYDILSPDEISIVDAQRAEARGKRLDKLMGKKSLSKTQRAVLTKTLVELTYPILVGVPNDIKAKLKDPQLIQVAEVFTTLPFANAIKKMVEAGEKSDGSKPSRSSQGSTAARRNGGSKKRRSVSSGPSST